MFECRDALVLRRRTDLLAGPDGMSARSRLLVEEERTGARVLL